MTADLTIRLKVMALFEDANKFLENVKMELSVQEEKFTTTFSIIGYLGIKMCLDKGKVNYSRVLIVQSSDLKEIIE